MSEPEYGIRPPAYRLPDGTRVGVVRLQVSSLDRSLDYYERVLGFRVLSRGAQTAALAPRSDDRVLVELRARSGARRVPRRGAIGLFHFAILLPDRASLGRFLSHTGHTGVHAGSADHAVSEAVYLTDPDGLGIEVYADRPRSTWRRNGRQLFMTTEPLDVRAVIGAAGDEPWTGMPPGSIMGHVHLHVGDLQRAADFYHAALGFDKVVWDYPGALFLSAGGYHHHLGTNTWSSGPPAAEDEARLISWDVVVPHETDAAAAAGSLQQAGYSVAAGEDGWTAADPWGTTLRIVSTHRP